MLYAICLFYQYFYYFVSIFIAQVMSTLPKHSGQQFKSVQQNIRISNTVHYKLKNQKKDIHCMQCLQKNCLIQKYVKLIQLLKRKIIKLRSSKQKINVQSHLTYDASFLLESEKRLISGISNQQIIKKSCFAIQQIQNQTKKCQLKKIYVNQISQTNNSFHPISKNSNNIMKNTVQKQNYLILSQNLQFQKKQSSLKLLIGNQINKAQFPINHNQNSYKTTENMRIGSFRQIFSNSLTQSHHSKQKFLREQDQLKDQYQYRINRLIHNILDLKALFMHVRETIYHFIRTIGMQFFKSHQKKYNNSNALEMLWVLMNIFQYSQLQRQEMLENKNIKLRKKQTMTDQINKSMKNIFVTLKNL